MDPELPTNFPMIDQIDHEILMHKQVHFSGSFPAMISYYDQEKIGAVLPVTIDRIQELHLIEEQTGYDLCTLVLSEKEIAEIHEAKQAYVTLEKLGTQTEGSDWTDLVFSEQEDPEELIEILAKNEHVTPLLLETLKRDDYYNSLYPGYGLAPMRAAQIIALKKESKAIPLLFEKLGELDFEMESQFFSALSQIGQEAQDFLIQILNRTGWDKDSEKAAVALSYFPENLQIAQASLDKLQTVSLEHSSHELICLINNLAGFKGNTESNKLQNFLNTTSLHPQLKEEINHLKKLL